MQRDTKSQRNAKGPHTGHCFASFALLLTPISLSLACYPGSQLWVLFSVQGSGNTGVSKLVDLRQMTHSGKTCEQTSRALQGQFKIYARIYRVAGIWLPTNILSCPFLRCRSIIKQAHFPRKFNDREAVEHAPQIANRTCDLVAPQIEHT